MATAKLLYTVITSLSSFLAYAYLLPLTFVFSSPYPFVSYRGEILFSHESFGLTIHIGHLRDAQTPYTIPKEQVECD